MLEPVADRSRQNRLRSAASGGDVHGPKRTRAGQLKKDELGALSGVSDESEWCATSSSSDDEAGSHVSKQARQRRRTCGSHLWTYRNNATGVLQNGSPAFARRTPTRSPAYRLRTSTIPKPPLSPHVNPFRHDKRVAAPAQEKRSAPFVFLRSPHSRRLRRFERSPPVAPMLRLSPIRKAPLSWALRPGAELPRNNNSEDFAWFDASDSELSSVPSSHVSSSEPDLDETPTHIPPQRDPSANVERLVDEKCQFKRQLLRRRRSSLVRMCKEQHLCVNSDATKAVLADHLICNKPPSKGSQSDSKEVHALDLEKLDLVDHEIAPNKLEKHERIGSGAFKDVYKGVYHASRTRVFPVAICELRDRLTEADIKELTFLRDLRHENLVRFIGVSIPTNFGSAPPCVIVSELCEHGDLFDYIRNTPPPPDVDIFRILLQIARGLEYLHTRKPMIVHRDCKSTNVLINAQGVAKITDFGLARVKGSERAMIRSLVGTVNWQAVELWSPKPNYNEKVDVWGAAMTFWEALQWHQPEKRYPFQGMNEHQIYDNVRQRHLRPFTGSIRRRFGDDIVHLLDRMWEQSPRDRPSMSEVCTELEHLMALQQS